RHGRRSSDDQAFGAVRRRRRCGSESAHGCVPKPSTFDLRALRQAQAVCFLHVFPEVIADSSANGSAGYASEDGALRQGEYWRQVFGCVEGLLVILEFGKTRSLLDLW